MYAFFFINFLDLLDLCKLLDCFFLTQSSSLCFSLSLSLYVRFATFPYRRLFFFSSPQCLQLWIYFNSIRMNSLQMWTFLLPIPKAIDGFRSKTRGFDSWVKHQFKSKSKIQNLSMSRVIPLHISGCSNEILSKVNQKKGQVFPWNYHLDRLDTQFFDEIFGVRKFWGNFFSFFFWWNNLSSFFSLLGLGSFKGLGPLLFK